MVVFNIHAASDIKYSYLNEEHTSVRAEFVIHAPADEIWSFLTNYDEHDEVLPNIKKVTVLESSASTTLTETVVQSGPFTMKYKSLLKQDKSHYKIHWDQTEGPFQTFSGGWKLSPIDAENTTVIYDVMLEHAMMPNGVKNALLKGSIPDMRLALKKRLEN